jgi:hypothetical protein
MNDRQRVMAVLNYQPYDRMPVVHFGYWTDTLAKWAAEGHITDEEVKEWGDGNPTDVEVSRRLGFDFNYYCVMHCQTHIEPGFERKEIEELPDGSKKVLNAEGVVILEKAGTSGIPSEIDHLLKDRKAWEENYLPRLQFSEDRVLKAKVRVGEEMIPFDEGGLEYLRSDERDYPFGLHCGSLFGRIRNIVGLTGVTYLYADDEGLFDEMVNTYGDLCYRCAKLALKSGAKFDFAHFWEDICFKNGPLVSPAVFEEKVGPHYRRITDLVKSYGIDIVSLDCDGLIDALIPTWFNNGVNTMFPIEVGTWNASIAPWRARFGKGLRGVGGMNKNVLSRDFAAIDVEIERLRPLVDLGGFIPCPDHRLAPDAEWDNVRYYCDHMRQVFG